MNRTTSLVIAISLLLLGGAFLASRALTAEVAPPASAEVAPRLAVVASPPLGEPPRPAPLPAAPLPVVPSAPPLAPRPVPPPPPPPGESESEAAAEITALVDQSWGLLKDLRSGPANWHRAERGFRRCLSQAPDDERCKAGLAAASERLGPRTVSPSVRRPPSSDEE